jgi:hypothetical protein
MPYYDNVCKKCGKVSTSWAENEEVEKFVNEKTKFVHGLSDDDCKGDMEIGNIRHIPLPKKEKDFLVDLFELMKKHNVTHKKDFERYFWHAHAGETMFLFCGEDFTINCNRLDKYIGKLKEEKEILDKKIE